MNLSGRIVVFCWSILMLASIVNSMIQGHGNLVSSKGTDISGPAAWYVASVFGSIAGFGVWFSVFHRKQRDNPNESTAPLESEPDSLVSQFWGLTRARKYIVVNLATKTIRFVNCHTRRKFFAIPESEFVCPFDHILDVHEFTYRGNTELTIVTKTGTVDVPNAATNYEHLSRLLSGIREFTPLGPAVDHLLKGVVFMGAAFTGIFLGVAITPRSSNNSIIGMFALAGAMTGVGLTSLLIHSVDRLFGRRIVIPVGFAILGGYIGLIAGFILARATDWSGAIFCLTVGTGSLAGLVIAILKQKLWHRAGKTLQDAQHKNAH